MVTAAPLALEPRPSLRHHQRDSRHLGVAARPSPHWQRAVRLGATCCHRLRLGAPQPERRWQPSTQLTRAVG